MILYENKIKAELHENVEDKDSGEHYFEESIQEWEEELMEADDVLDSIKDNVEETVKISIMKAANEEQTKCVESEATPDVVMIRKKAKTTVPNHTHS